MRKLDYQLLSTDKSGQQTDLTGLAQHLSWTGDGKTAARRLTMSAAQTARDTHQPQPVVALGDAAELLIGGDSVYVGTWLDSYEDTDGTTYERVAYDRGFQFKQNSDYISVSNQTPEEIAAMLADRCGCELGRVASTGVRLSRNFLPGDYYSVLRTLYAMASEQTDVRYRIRFDGGALQVVEMSLTAETLLLRPGSNLLRCAKTESAHDLINRVRIYDDADNLTETLDNTESQTLYGVFQAAIKQSGHKDAAAAARQTLKDKDMTSTLTCDCLGSRRLVTGNTVVIHEPRMDLYGLCHIQSDVHTIERGIWRTRVQVSLEDLISADDAALAAKE